MAVTAMLNFVRSSNAQFCTSQIVCNEVLQIQDVIADHSLAEIVLTVPEILG